MLLRNFCAACFAMLVTTGLAAASAQAVHSVSALGRIEPEHGIVRLTSPLNLEALTIAVIAEIHVRAGDDVKANSLIAVMDAAPTLNAMVAEAEAELVLSQRQVELVRASAREICVKARVAQRESDRRVALLEKGLAGEEEAEAAAGEAESMAASCDAAKTAIASAEARVEVNRAHITRRRADLDRAFLRAPFAGRILKVIAHPGESANHGVVELARIDRMLAIAEVFETDIALVKIGQKATVASDALPNQLSGTVQKIRPKVARQEVIDTDPSARKDARIIEVEILLDDPTKVANLTNLQVDVMIEP